LSECSQDLFEQILDHTNELLECQRCLFQAGDGIREGDGDSASLAATTATSRWWLKDIDHRLDDVLEESAVEHWLEVLKVVDHLWLLVLDELLDDGEQLSDLWIYSLQCLDTLLDVGYV